MQNRWSTVYSIHILAKLLTEWAIKYWDSLWKEAVHSHLEAQPEMVATIISRTTLDLEISDIYLSSVKNLLTSLRYFEQKFSSRVAAMKWPLLVFRNAPDQRWSSMQPPWRTMKKYRPECSMSCGFAWMVDVLLHYMTSVLCGTIFMANLCWYPYPVRSISFMSIDLTCMAMVFHYMHRSHLRCIYVSEHIEGHSPNRACNPNPY